MFAKALAATRFPPRESRVDTATEKYQCEIRTKVLLDTPTQSQRAAIEKRARELRCDWGDDAAPLKKLSLRRNVECKLVWDPHRASKSEVNDYTSFARKVLSCAPRETIHDALLLERLAESGYDSRRAKRQWLDTFGLSSETGDYSLERENHVRAVEGKLHARARSLLPGGVKLSKLESMIRDNENEESTEFLRSIKQRADNWRRDAANILSVEGGGTCSQVEALLMRARSELPLIETREYTRLESLKAKCDKWISENSSLFNGITKISLAEARRRLNDAERDFPEIIIDEVSQLKMAVKLVSEFHSVCQRRNIKLGNVPPKGSKMQLAAAILWLRKLDTSSSFIHSQVWQDFARLVDQGKRWAMEARAFLDQKGAPRSQKTVKKIKSILSAGSSLALEVPELTLLRSELSSMQWMAKYDMLCSRAKGRGPWLSKLEDLIKESRSPPIREEFVSEVRETLRKGREFEIKAKAAQKDRECSVHHIKELLKEASGISAQSDLELSLERIVRKTEDWEKQTFDFFEQYCLHEGNGNEPSLHSVPFNKAQTLFQQSVSHEVRTCRKKQAEKLRAIVNAGKQFRSSLKKTLKSLESRYYKEKEQKERQRSLVDLRGLIMSYDTKYLHEDKGSIF
eukprot:182040-Amorphochlora_amoeboformis.AAC.2